MGGIDYSLYSETDEDTTITGNMGFGGGLLLGIGPIEIGAIYLSRSITIDDGILPVTVAANALEIPVLYRFSGPIEFGIGAFYDLPMVSGNEGNYGLAAGPRISITGALFLDVRFNYGLKTGNSKDLLGMVGYSFGKTK